MEKKEIIHHPFEQPDAYRSLSMPIYQTAAYEFESAEDMERAFKGESSDYTYSRIANPTVQYFEDRVKRMSGAYSVTAFSSGMAAISNLFFTLAYTGANVITSRHLFGNTYSFLNVTLRSFGVEVRFCDLNDSRAIEEVIDENTVALFLEVVTNPQLEVVDLERISEITRRKRIPLVVDSTIVPFHQFSARRYGVDLEVVSSTKYISAGATSTGGLLLDYGVYDWSYSSKLKEVPSQNAQGAFTFKLRREIHRNLGAYMSPQVAALQNQGLDTLEIRYERQAQTCLSLAKRLQAVTGICSVNYPTLPGSPYAEIARRQFGEYAGAMLVIELASKEACFRFINRLKMIRRATNLFDHKSLAIHPASTIYGLFNSEQKAMMNVSEHAIRLSIGLESEELLFEDICQALL